MAARAHGQYVVPGMDAVETHSQLTYATRDGAMQRYDVYGPRPGRTSPVVLRVHGGPIPADLQATPADWGLFQSLARMLATCGIAAVMFNHRFFSLGSALTATNDIEDLLSHLDFERVCLWGFSDGGPLLARFLRHTPASVRCVITYYAALHASTSEFSAADAVQENTGWIPPMLVARAGLDMPQLNETIDRFVTTALKKNTTLDVMNHATGPTGSIAAMTTSGHERSLRARCSSFKAICRGSSDSVPSGTTIANLVV
jgi:pimeloyl-ACP methyl ester carboxylesterase